MELLNDSNYKQKTAHGNVVVKFSAEWCQPCKVLQPAIDRLQEAWQGKVSIYGVDVDKTSVAGAMSVTGIPCLIFYKSGLAVRRLIGVHDYNRLNLIMTEIYGK